MVYHLIRLGIPGPLYWVASPKRWTPNRSEATQFKSKEIASASRNGMARDERRLVQVKEVTEEN